MASRLVGRTGISISEPSPSAKRPTPSNPRPILHLKGAEQGSYLMRISFDCRAHCSCVWRALLDRRGIYPLASALSSSTPVLHALKGWISNIKEMSWDDWVEEDLVVLMSLLENVSGTRETSSADSRLCQSWIRKVARQTGTLPTSFILQGVRRESENAVAGGGFADVYAGVYAGREVALKVLRVFVKENRREVIKNIMHETLFWRYLDHPHILPLLGVSQNAMAPRLSLVTPWMANGNILEYLEHDADQLSLVIQCSHGICYLHEYTPGLIHGDIRCANILIDEERKVRIADFGLLNISESQAHASSLTVLTDGGSMRWIAPELFGPQMRTTRCTDVYAFGMTILEVYTRSPPFKDLRKDVQVMVAVSQGCRPERPNESIYMEDELWTLITDCWSADSKDRPHIRRVMERLESIMDQRVAGTKEEVKKLTGRNNDERKRRLEKVEIREEDEEGIPMPQKSEGGKAKEVVEMLYAGELEKYFKAFSSANHSYLVTQIVRQVFKMTEVDAKSVATYFEHAAKNQLCAPASFEEGFQDAMVDLDNIAASLPAVFKLMAILMKGKHLPRRIVEELSDMIIVNGDPVVLPRKKFLDEYEKLP